MNLSLKVNKFQFNRFSISFIYAIVLAFIIPLDEIKDFSNYVIYAGESGQVLSRNLSNSFGAFLFNDPVFLVIMALLKFLIPEQEIAAKMFYFMTAFFLSYTLLGVSKRFFLILCLLLIFPNVLRYNLVQIRQGFAIALFLYAYQHRYSNRSIFLILLTPFIHSSFFIILCLLIVADLAKVVRFSSDVIALIAMSLGLMFTHGFLYVAGVLGARQAERYADAVTDVSGLAFVFWSVVLMLFMGQNRLWRADHRFEILVIVFYLTTYFLSPHAGRIFGSVFLLLVIGGFSLPPKSRSIYLFLVIFFSILDILNRVGKPWLGFGYYI